LREEPFALTLKFEQLIPSLVSPNRNVFVRPLLLSRLRSFSTPLYLVALCLVGARIHLGLPSTFTLEETLPSTEEGLLAIRPSKLLKGIMGSSVWAGISIIVFSVSSQQSSFAQQRSLRQTSRAHTFAEDSTLKKIRRVGWLAAAFFGLLGSSLINMAWGLVGYLAIPNGGKQVNIFLSLPQKDGLLSFARLLVLITLLATLPASLRSGRKAFRRLVVLPQRIKGPPVSLRMTAVKSKSVPRTSRAVLSSSEDEPSDDEQAPRERRKPKFKFITRLSALICWLATVTLAIVFGHGDKLVSAIEIVSCVGCTLITFLMPGMSCRNVVKRLLNRRAALFFIVLFHIRKARTIFVSDETVVNNDALLLKKEQQLQVRSKASPLNSR
jgi:amino acid permease